MKITLVTQYLEGHGGTERVISELINHDLKNSYQVLVPSSGKPEWLQWFNRQGGYSVKICHRKTEQEKRCFVIQNILTEKPAIVLCLEGKANKLASYVRKHYHLHFKIISWGHTSITDSKNFMKENIHYADYHLAISSGIKKQLIDFGVAPENVFLIFNPIQTDSNKIIARPKTESSFHAVFIGRILLDDQKNVRMLLHVLSKLPFKWLIDIFGQGKDLHAAQQMAHQLNIDQNIIWHGWTPNPWDQISEADCLLLCSTYEGFPMVVIEAVSHGLPVISTDCPTGPADIINAKNGILTPMNDQGAFVDACSKIYYLRNELDRHQIKKTAVKFDVQNYISKLQHIYAYVNTKKLAITS
ncbi:UDP-D-galactose (glucosyl)lipopolysaccharide-1, 6-D-galactosyltransferase [Liquorilactobacillus aquaticus DSM 21051]|uniref:UDP-D-galactose (Glucosyl)lipopolysaccharide-1, 6-D-galactosyltransferase n=1 Tax=Liquorilactobacillus aquaticus DSM 21051 TaxID=1423725 RepID=A0A0R2D7H5_9LACO|nr:glycosyltransferase [Liquorilactobacillus aquaticus]KRM96454.1 UDP-D-galactose (glucosyl)lipopolysaccharide-1, 6-D-galactosyltransferase [Liquorilactobacillus aquaticus DSM 21051]